MLTYLYQCSKCGKKVKIRQRLMRGIPLCCGKAMQALPPLLVKTKGGGRIPIFRSAGYKAGYSREYLRRLAETDPNNPKYRDIP